MKMIFLSLVLMTTQGFAMGSKSKDQQRGEQFKKELNLTDEQVAKFKELKKNKSEVRDLKAKFKESKKAFRDAVGNANASNDEIRAKFEAFMKLRDEFQRKRFEHMLQKRAILTPEQITKFNGMMKRWHGKHGKRKDW
jgi:Spy/CpxP family protein refolding chaperone